MSCQIFIKRKKGQTRTVCVNSEELKNMTVKEFIIRFCPEEEDDLDRCRFIFAGRQLKGDSTLGSYDIKDCSTIHMTARLRGGGDPLPPEDEGMSRTASMEVLAEMQQTEPESKRLCCMM